MNPCSSSQINATAIKPYVPPLPYDVEFNFPPLLTSRGQDVVIKAFGAKLFRTICAYYFSFLKRAEFVFTNETLKKVPSKNQKVFFFHLLNDIYAVKAKPFAYGSNKLCHLSVNLNTCEVINISRSQDVFVLQEIEILTHLRSRSTSLGYRHISHLKDWCASGLETYQFSDYANEHTIMHFAQKHKMTHGLRLNFTKQILLGLSFIHASGYIHLDIKPTNILVSQSCAKKYAVKICDFGAAAQENNFEQKRVLRGTLLFSSPEQELFQNYDVEPAKGSSNATLPEFYTSGINQISYPSDIYSLGMTLQFLFGNGTAPFKNFWEKHWGNQSPLVDPVISNRPTANDCLISIRENIRSWNIYKHKTKGNT